MKTKLLRLSAIIIVMVISIAAIQPIFKLMTSPLGSKMEEAMAAWEGKRAEKGEPTYEADYTIWDFGIRYRYSVLKEFVNIKTLGELAGEPVFISGPHGEVVDFNSAEFGHYNPAFLETVKNTLQEGMNNTVFNGLAQAFYTNEMSGMARTYYRAYQYLQAEGNIIEKYENDYQSPFVGYADSEEKLGYNWADAYVAPSFWVRRTIDGTDKQFIEMLEMVMKAYDTDFQMADKGETASSIEGAMERAMSLWSVKKAQNANPELATDGTWLDVGIRYKYLLLKDYVNIKTLGKLAGVPVFSKGPHSVEVNYNANEFGYYNPAFLAKVKAALKKGMNNTVFNNLAQTFYNNELKGMARTYYRAFVYLNNQENVIEQYGGNYDGEAFRSYADSEEKLGYDWYESDVAPGFWVRRKIDGTDKTFFEILQMVMSTYDSDFKE